MSTSTAATAATPQASILAQLNQASAASTGTSASSTKDKVDAQQDRFLRLLTTQLKNQDPLSPMDNAQVTSQLAQISTVDGIERLNATLEKLMGNATDAQAVQAAALVGHSVMVPGAGLILKDGAAMGAVDLAADADKVTVTISDAHGLPVRILDLGAREAGSHAFKWDGLSDAGSAAANGRYKLTVTARQGEGTVSATALEQGLVTSITRNSQGFRVEVGGVGAFPLGDVKQIL